MNVHQEIVAWGQLKIGSKQAAAKTKKSLYKGA
jgi:hypothetical protein